MNQLRTHLSIALAFGLLTRAGTFAKGLSVGHAYSPGSVKIVLGNAVADIHVDLKDAKLTHIAAGLLAHDVQRVTGKKPRVINDPDHRHCMQLWLNNSAVHPFPFH